MFRHLISKYKFNSKSPLKAVKLSDNPQFLDQVTKWIEKKWGYLRCYPGVEKRKEKYLPVNILYVVLYEGKLGGKFVQQPVGMFALEVINPPKLAIEEMQVWVERKRQKLLYVYVDESFRDMGVGGWIIEKAKEIAKSEGAELLQLDTLTPKLNKLYVEKHRAKVTGEDYLQFEHHETKKLLSYPINTLCIDLDSKGLTNSKESKVQDAAVEPAITELKAAVGAVAKGAGLMSPVSDVGKSNKAASLSGENAAANVAIANLNKGPG
jgi:GNAT superfamily N-acetyltransferase